MIVTDECGSGHESAGEVFQVGEGVEAWKVGESSTSFAFLIRPVQARADRAVFGWLGLVGDRVAIEAGVPCENCSFLPSLSLVRAYNEEN